MNETLSKLVDNLPKEWGAIPMQSGKMRLGCRLGEDRHWINLSDDLESATATIAMLQLLEKEGYNPMVARCGNPVEGLYYSCALDPEHHWDGKTYIEAVANAVNAVKGQG